MEVFEAMWHLHLDSVLGDEKEEILVINRAICFDRLHAHYGQVTKHFTL